MNKQLHSLLSRLHWWFFGLAVLDLIWAGVLNYIILEQLGGVGSYFSPQPWPSWIFGGLLALVLWSFSILNWIAYRRARQLRNRTFLMIVATLDLLPLVHCMYVLGMPTGILALVTLNNRSVAKVFDAVAAGESREQALQRLYDAPPRFTAADEMDTANDDWDQAGRSQ